MFMLFTELFYLFCLLKFIMVPPFFFVECSCLLESQLDLPDCPCVSCKLDVVPKRFRVQFNIFGNNISKPGFSASHSIISGSAEGHADAVSGAERGSLVRVIVVWL